jgi:TRAP-type C4-dicarboxylate transport system permease small subunit
MSVQSKAARIVSLADKIGLIIEKVSGAVCVICFVAMTMVAIMGVFFRYVMQSPFMWTEEVARYLMVWLGFTAINIAMRQDRHIKVEVLPKLVPAVAAKIIGYFVDALMVFFFFVLLKQGYLLMINNIMMASTFHLSMSWILAAVPAAAALTLIQLFLRVIKNIFSEFEHQPEPSA